MNNLLKQVWFNLSLIPFLTHENYVNIICTNKKINTIITNLLDNITDDNEKKHIFNLYEHLLKKKSVGFGGIVRDYLLNVTPNDIDIIVPKYFLTDLVKELFFKTMMNRHFRTELNLFDGINFKERLVTFINEIENYDFCCQHHNKINLKNVVKNILEKYLHIDIIRIENNAQYLMLNWNIMFTVHVFYYGMIIKLDVKFTNDNFEGDFKCNALSQKMINGKLEMVTLVKQLSVEECVSDCLKKIASPIEKINKYTPYFYCTKNCNCSKIHLAVNNSFFNRIEKMLGKRFTLKISDIEKFSNANELVPYESCFKHCESFNKICNNCKTEYIVNFKENYSYNETLCHYCINKLHCKKLCKQCKLYFHDITYNRCFNCNTE